MGKIWITCVLAGCLIAACGRDPASQKGKPEVSSVPKVIVEKEEIEREPSLPPEVKIKLKKDGKDSYSWEISGSDADQILKINEKLRKHLGEEKPR